MTFAFWNSPVSLLRLIALRDPDCYLRHFSGPVGSGLTHRITAAFEEQGFECRTNVSLRRFGADLPDVNLIVIAEEPTFGFMVIICEVKAPLPPLRAKDALRVLQPDSVAKAFAQLERIGDFIRTERGRDFLRELLPEDGLSGFEEFVVAVPHLVITSDNAGAMFSDQDTAIIDFRTLERLLGRSDGDHLHLWASVRQLCEYADESLRLIDLEVDVGDTKVVFEAVTIRQLLDFKQVSFRSIGLRQKLAEEVRQEQARPLDFFRHDLPKPPNDRQPDFGADPP